MYTYRANSLGASTTNNFLIHHGTKGQRWGVRRYQNLDGTLTSEGKERYHPGSTHRDSGEKKNTFDKKKATKYAVAAVATVSLAAASVYISKNPAARKAVVNLAKNVGETIGKNGYKATKSLAEAPGKIVKAEVRSLKNVGKNAGKAYLDSANSLALAALGAYAISKVDEHYSSKQQSDNKIVNKANEINKEAIKSGIKAGTQYRPGGNLYSVKQGGSVGRDVSHLIGAPSSHGPVVQNNDKRWNDLFKNNDVRGNENLRGTIKDLRRQGYDMDQIEAYVYGGMWRN